ncbi:MAG: hypothetical protein HXL96_06670 [[Eubacterium] sulci]|nr:hypothetical protein [[Eubacterium] sulci]
MAKSFPFESKRIIGNEWDRAITAQDERDFNKMCWGNGVFINPIDGLMVTAHGGMTVNVKPGGAIIEGAVFKENNNRQITLSPASSLPRIDRIVLRFDTAEDRRDIDIYLKEGVAATNPVAQDLIRESNYYELAIADVYIPARTTSIESVNISDTRMDSNLCGWVVPAVEYRGLFDNLWLQLRDSFGTVNSALSGTLAQDIKQEIKVTDEKYADQIKRVRDDMGDASMLKTSARNLADAINELYNGGGRAQDYVMEQGEVDGWQYIKWKRGRLELIKIVDTDVSSTWTMGQWNGMVWNSKIFNFPTTYRFISTPFTSASVTIGSGYTGACQTTSTKSNVKLMVSGSQSAANGVTNLQIYAIGKWK